jgi:hypothetical protein
MGSSSKSSVSSSSSQSSSFSSVALGTPIVVAGDCSNLAAVGTWENITPPGSWSKAVNGTVSAAIIVDPFNANRLWLGAGNQNNEIWRSDDCGGSWTRVNIGPGSWGDRQTYGGVGDGAQWSMQADFSEPGVLYATSGYGAQSVWKTTDGGYSWTDVLKGSLWEAHQPYRFANNISIDPTNPKHLVVSSHGECTPPYGPSCNTETWDGGETWTVSIAPEGWVEGGGVIIVEGSTWIWCGNELMITQDSGATWQPNKLAGGGSCSGQYTISPLNRASNGNYYLGSTNGVLRSADGVNWEHVPNSHGFQMMLTQGSTDLFVADSLNPVIRTAKLEKDDQWSAIPAPPQISQGTDGGIPFIAYDDENHILYASMYSGGVARMRIK